MPNSVLERHLPVVQAAGIMGVIERHTKRLLTVYRKDGPAALASGNRERRHHNATPETAVVKLASNGYAGANHTHLTELLREREGIDPSPPTVRRILVKAGIGSPRGTASGAGACPRRRCWHRLTAASILGRRNGDPSWCCSSPWTTPPAQWPRPYSALLRTPWATWCSLRAWSVSGVSPWLSTATATLLSSTTLVKSRCLSKPPSSPG